ncbi:class I alpha-mannosidase [Pseudozyma hubeiensis SY62]|uniref:Class I alpha-mannosidase n=1 Tax=Pseudozyma hubeiensis (strain SY62) TaxID=1305764 RepID=R9NXX7_PSEHS|nr:class I alpha-mannosidase [Pseudozyma hubeiensis SY62]GAC93417.1 class I alpha-mannosidase [Pseudozyma hubeiensis SY62]
MGAKVISTLHVLAAIVSWIAAVVHCLVHPLSVPSITICVVLASIGGVIIAQEFASVLSIWSRCKPRLLSSYHGRALCFFLAAAILFDRLADLPCDLSTTASSLPTSPAKFSISAGDAAHNVPAVPPSQPSKEGSSKIKQKGPPVFGTAFYLCRPLAPKCTRIDTVPGQAAGSVAWVNIQVNKISRLLMFATCASTLAVCLVYIVLALMYRSGKVDLSPGMACAGGRGRDGPYSLEFHPMKPPGLNHDQVDKGAGSPSSAYRINMHGNDPSCCRCMPPDLYQEQRLSDAVGTPVDNHRASDDTSLAPPRSLRRIESTGTARPVESALDPAQGAASTPDQIFRNERLDPSSVSTRAASDTLPLGKTKKLERGGEVSPHSVEVQRLDKYGYENGYSRNVDYASGCIVHYPIFSNKKKPKATQVVAATQTFPTLSPPDFSRKSFGSYSGLTPRQSGKRGASDASKSNETRRVAVQQRQKSEEAGDEGAVDAKLHDAKTEAGVASSVEQTTHPSKGNGNIVVAPHLAGQSAPALLSPSGIDQPSPFLTSKYPAKPAQAHSNPTPDTHDDRRLGTADSSRSFVSTYSTAQPHTFTSRPGTATSTKSHTSLRLMQRRRRGLLATLDLHLGTRLSGISQDARAGKGGAGERRSTDSGRSCSAGTFGGGEGGSPVSTPKCA